jgi:hypothetical protein
MAFLAGFAAAFVYGVIVVLQLGDIADKRWRTVLWGPAVSAAALIGIGEGLSSRWGMAGYIVGSTLADLVGIWLRRRGK